MTRNYQEPCPTCGNALPKGPAKLARHYEKHKQIFALRAKFTKDPDRKEHWEQLTLQETRANQTGLEQGAEAGQAALSDHSR